MLRIVLLAFPFLDVMAAPKKRQVIQLSYYVLQNTYNIIMYICFLYVLQRSDFSNTIW